MKLFKTRNINVVKYRQECFSFDLPSDLWRKRVTKFKIIFFRTTGRKIPTCQITTRSVHPFRRQTRTQGHKHLSCLSLFLSVSFSRKSVFYRNGWTDRVVIWHVGIFRPILRCVLRKFRYLQKYGYFPLELCPKLRT